MIRIWLSPKSSTPLRQQISAQLLLGILSGRLAPGERLPSVRQLAQRLHVHRNTVFTVYRDLASRAWIETRHGSGVFVRTAREADHTESRHAAHLLVVDPDLELARIIASELSGRLARPVEWTDDSHVRAVLTPQSRIFASAGKLARIAEALPGCAIEAVRLASMPDMLAGYSRPKEPVLIAVVSRSESVLDWARTLLAALGFSSDHVLLRNPGTRGWRRGLPACQIVAADVCASQDIPPGSPHVVFQILAGE